MLDDIGPFGSENPKPIFAAKDIKIINPKIVGESENHISCHISDKSGKTIKGIAFHSANNSLGKVMLTYADNNSSHLSKPGVPGVV